jgi:hypothetical protein
MPEENPKPKMNTHTILLLVIIGVLIVMYFMPRNQGGNIQSAIKQLDSARLELDSAQYMVKNTHDYVDSLKMVFANYQQFVSTMDKKVDELNAAHKKNEQEFIALVSKTQNDYKKNKARVITNLIDTTKVFDIDTIH